MIHYLCDICKRSLDQEEDLRYVVRMEIYAALDHAEIDMNNDQDHLENIQDILERLDEMEEAHGDEDIYQQLRFDLCCDCRKKFLRDPLGRRQINQLNFSQN